MLGLEQSILGQLVFQGFELQMQPADALILHHLGHQLVGALGWIDRQPPGAKDVHTGPKLPGRGVHGQGLIGLEPRHLQRGQLILESEVYMPGSGSGHAAHLSLNPDKRELGLQDLLNGLGQLTYREDVGHGISKRQGPALPDALPPGSEVLGKAVQG